MQSSASGNYEVTTREYPPNLHTGTLTTIRTIRVHTGRVLPVVLPYAGTTGSTVVH
jgi:hypothetical protein